MVSYKILIIPDLLLSQTKINNYDNTNFLDNIKTLRAEYAFGLYYRSNHRPVNFIISFLCTYKSGKILAHVAVLDSISYIPVYFCHTNVPMGYEFIG